MPGKHSKDHHRPVDKEGDVQYWLQGRLPNSHRPGSAEGDGKGYPGALLANSHRAALWGPLYPPYGIGRRQPLCCSGRHPRRVTSFAAQGALTATGILPVIVGSLRHNTELHGVQPGERRWPNARLGLAPRPIELPFERCLDRVGPYMLGAWSTPLGKLAVLRWAWSTPSRRLVEDIGGGILSWLPTGARPSRTRRSGPCTLSVCGHLLWRSGEGS